MAKKQFSFRFDPDVSDIIKTNCDGNQTEYVSNCIKNNVILQNNSDDPEGKEFYNKLIQSLPKAEASYVTSDDGKLIKVELVWPENDNEGFLD